MEDILIQSLQNWLESDEFLSAVIPFLSTNGTNNNNNSITTIIPITNSSNDMTTTAMVDTSTNVSNTTNNNDEETSSITDVNAVGATTSANTAANTAASSAVAPPAAVTIINSMPITSSINNRTIGATITTSVLGPRMYNEVNGFNSQQNRELMIMNNYLSVPKFYEYAQQHKRWETFQLWPPLNNPISRQELVQCGLFYSEVKRKAGTCFHCGETLEDWGLVDSAWVLHAIMNSSCRYIQAILGSEFIRAAQLELDVGTAGCITLSAVANHLNKSVDEILSKIQGVFNSGGQDIADPLIKTILSFDKEFQEATTSANTDENNTLGILSPNQFIDSLRPTSSGSGVGVSSSLSSEKMEDEEDDEENSEIVINKYKKLKNLFSCKICLDRLVGVVFLPCGHLCACVLCASSIHTCAVCRQKIKGLIKTYI